MLFLGVDGGGTKTSFMIINEKGKILAYTREKSCHYLEHGLDGFREVIQKGLQKLIEELEVSISDINYSFFGIPCYGEIEEDIPVLEGIVKELLGGTDNFKCGNDVEAGWAGSLACNPGINIVAGTGAIGFGRDQSGNTARASGWGYFMGDEGSAYWIGKRLISLFTKEADGRLDKTALYEIMRDEFDLKKDFDLIDIVYEDMEMKRDKIAQLAPLLDKAVAAGDPRAKKIFSEAAYEHSLTVKAILQKLDFDLEEDLLISYSGGVFQAGDFILKPFKTQLLDNDYIDRYNFRMTEPVLEPVTGAALYAAVLAGNIQNLDLLVNNLKKEEKRGIYK
ncbi:MAG: N-acetylglucosamine kinase [Halanaerobiales bacterium]